MKYRNTVYVSSLLGHKSRVEEPSGSFLESLWKHFVANVAEHLYIYIKPNNPRNPLLNVNVLAKPLHTAYNIFLATRTTHCCLMSRLSLVDETMLIDNNAGGNHTSALACAFLAKGL